jgi:tripartite-type tricarboxylate transporter receptor subunit TctC
VTLPEVKTFAEMGVPGVDTNNWYAVFVKAGTSKSDVDRLSAAIKKALRSEAVNSKLLQSGAEPVGSTPEELASILRADINKWTHLIKAKKITAD